MSTSKFSNPFMMKSPLTPLEGNAFIKAVKDARDNNKTSFTFNGKNYPLKMETPLDLTAKQAQNLPSELVEIIKKNEESPVKMEDPTESNYTLPSPLREHEFGHVTKKITETKQPRFIKNPNFDKLTDKEKKEYQIKAREANKIITYKGVKFDPEDGALINMPNPNYKK